MNKASVFNDITKLNAAAAYVRVSSQKQSETSLETQLDTIKRFARQNQLSIMRVYKDKITASGSREREDFNRMISDALEGVFNIILVYKYDRFHRDNVEEQNILRRLENNQIFVLSVTENIDTTTPAGRLLRWIMSGVNRFYIENLQQEIYDKTTKVALKAYFMGGVPPYGFKVVSRRDTEASRNRRLYAVDEEEAPAVRLAFELYAQGYSYATIIQRLDAQGYRTRSGGLWSMQTIYSMLRNEKYNGTYVFRKGNKKRSDTNREDTIRIEGAIPAIVSEDVFEQVQKRLQTKQKLALNDKQISLLSGFIYCGDCGSKMYANASARTHTYVCGRYSSYRDVVYTGVGMRKANRFVLGYIHEHHLPGNRNYEKLAQQVNAQARERNALIEVRIQSLGAELDKLKQRLENAKNAILDNTPLKDEILEDIPTLREQKQNIQARIEELQKQRSVMVSADFLRKRDRRIIQGLEGDLEAQRKIVRMLIKRVLVYRSGYIEVVPRKAFREIEGSFTELVQK